MRFIFLSTEGFKQKFVQLGLGLGEFLAFGILQAVVNIPILIAQAVIKPINDMLRGINDIPGVNIPLIPMPSIQDIPTNIIPRDPSGNPIFPGTQPDIGGGPMFGPVVPPGTSGPGDIIGGGTTAGFGGGSNLVVVQLVLDKRVIGEVAVDAVNKTAKYNAGLFPGSVGS